MSRMIGDGSPALATVIVWLRCILIEVVIRSPSLSPMGGRILASEEKP